MSRPHAARVPRHVLRGRSSQGVHLAPSARRRRLRSSLFRRLPCRGLASGVLGVVPVLTLGPCWLPPARRVLSRCRCWPRDTILTAQFIALDPSQNEFLASNTCLAVTR